VLNYHYNKGERKMDIISALAVSIGLLAGVATWLFLGPMGGLGLSLWAAFVAWATFYPCGGKEAGLQKTIVHNIFGAFLGWLALLARRYRSAQRSAYRYGRPSA